MMMDGWMVLELVHAKHVASALHSDHRWHPGNPHMAYRIDHYASFGWVTFMNSQDLGAGVVGKGGIG